MNNITFGNVLENLLYISNQKKSSLANNLGYDISYINKWISSKHLPSSKRINEICESIAEFIVSSLTDSTYDSLISYFEIDEDSDEDYLKKYIQEKLKEVYMDEARGMSDKTTQNMPKNTHSEEFYNSASSVRPTVVQKGFTNEIYSVVNKGEDLDIVLSFNLFDLNYKDRVSLGNMKKILYEISRNTKTKVTLLMGLKSGVDDCDDRIINALLGINLISTYPALDCDIYNCNVNPNSTISVIKDRSGVDDCDDRIINALLGINLISTYPALDCDIYNCNVNPNSTISVIKDRFLITTMHYPDGECLLSTYSKDKKLIEEVYYNLMYTQRQKGKPLCEKKTPLSMIEDQTYMQYIMNNDLRCVLGSINEFFMPPDSFIYDRRPNLYAVYNE